MRECWCRWPGTSPRGCSGEGTAANSFFRPAAGAPQASPGTGVGIMLQAAALRQGFVPAPGRSACKWLFYKMNCKENDLSAGRAGGCAEAVHCFPTAIPPVHGSRRVAAVPARGAAERSRAKRDAAAVLAEESAGDVSD